jgi:hypothetical protein
MSDLQLRVINGSATSEEVAAIIAVLTAITAANEEQPDTAIEQNWAKPAGLMRKSMPSSWAASYLVR